MLGRGSGSASFHPLYLGPMHHRSFRALRVLAAALLLLPLSNLPVAAQRPPAQPDAAGILHRMQKLNVLGSVLYIAAHPDDENTRLIAWLANGKKVRTGYLSLTRGEGGQNLIGAEMGDALGIIRTQELLEARRIDGGEQFFTRAVDFGFSKNAAESFAKWGKQEVLSDVVRVIRMFRPDIIITRFAPDRSAGHGHHEASAILAEEAFDLAGDPKAFPEHLEQGLQAWQPRRLFFNGSTWWKKDLADLAKNDPDWFTVDVGGYDPLLGLSYTEIAGRSRSMHKSQGFGAAETRGEMLEYLKLVKGDRPRTKDIFEGIDMTWGRVKGGAATAARVDALLAGFDPEAPEASAGMLEALAVELGSWASSEPWAGYIAGQLAQLVQFATGTTLEMLGDAPYHASGTPLGLHLDALLRRNVDMTLSHADGNEANGVWASTTLKAGEVWKGQLDLDGHAPVDEPFWLARPAIGARYAIDPPSRIGAAVADDGPSGRVTLTLARTGLPPMTVRAYHKWVDRVDGERIRPVYITPVASVIPKTDVLIATGGAQHITVEVEALTDSLTGQLNVTLPEGWATTKDLKLVDIAKRNERQRFTFQLIPGEHARPGAVRFTFTGPKGTADRTLHEIDHPHILPQVYYTPAEVELVPLDVRTTARTVGYIMGAGDEVPQALEQLGVAVEMIDPVSITAEGLKKYDAIVTGIRAYNTAKALKQTHPLLLKYVEDGGTLVIQYNTTPRFSVSGVSDFVIDPATLGPHPFKITRDRVTVEEAPPTFLDPKHPLLNTPNKITASDFEGWVQERGLYFPGELDPHYTPLIAWNDPGEQPLNGGLIVCDHGKGRYVYTGISFFRQLPAGVPGAYRLFANLISKRSD